MLKAFVEDLVGAFTQSGSKIQTVPNNIQYTAFRVQDEQIAADLHDWYIARQNGLEVIQEFVRENFTPILMKRECPYYFLDNDGRLAKVAYTGHIPEGWGGIPNTHWLEPKTGDAVRDVDALPKPSLKKLHEIIDWPTLEDQWFHSHELDAIRSINHMVTAYNDGSSTYVNVPHPDNFSNFPRVQSYLSGWEKPSWLVPAHEGAAPVYKLIVV